jgi:hypothetical protein
MIHPPKPIPIKFRRFLKKTKNELSLEEGKFSASSMRTKMLLDAFEGAPIIVHRQMLSILTDPYRTRLKRLRANPKFFNNYKGNNPPKELPLNLRRFPAAPQLSRRLFNTEVGNLLCWLALNPTLRPIDLAKVLNKSSDAIRGDLKKLVDKGLLIRVSFWCVHPFLQGKDNLFSEVKCHKAER